MQTAKEYNRINKDTYEDCCRSTFHFYSDQFWMCDVLYCACGAIIGDRNDALQKGAQLWLRTRKKLGMK